MKIDKARYIAENFDEVCTKDRVFLNNPVIFHSLGIAPLVVMDTSGRNALMLFVAVLLLLPIVRAIICASMLKLLLMSIISCACSGDT